MQPVVKPVDRSRQVGIVVQLRHQYGDGRFDIAASIMRLSSDLSRLDSVEPQRVVQTRLCCMNRTWPATIPTQLLVTA